MNISKSIGGEVERNNRIYADPEIKIYLAMPELRKTAINKDLHPNICILG